MSLQEDINAEFERAKEGVFTFTHLTALDLSLIELVALRKITACCVEDGLTGHEAAARFTAEYFGYLPDKFRLICSTRRLQVFGERGYDPVREYFRWVRDELHKP